MIAAEALAAGLDTPTLCELAGLPRNADARDIRDAFEQSALRGWNRVRDPLVAAQPAPACGTCFPVCPGSPAATGVCVRPWGSFRCVTRVPVIGTTLWSDGVWGVSSVPVECGGSRETVNRSGLARMGPVRLMRQPQPVLPGPVTAAGAHL